MALLGSFFAKFFVHVLHALKIFRKICSTIANFFNQSEFRKKPIRKNPITLIETLIVMGLVALTAGLLGLSVRKLIHEQRFRTESGIVLETLRLAQDLMLIADSDVHLTFTKDPRNGGMLIAFNLEKPLTKGWAREVMRQRKPLEAIRFIEYVDQRLGSRQVNQVQLHFLSGGAVMSQGTLRIADNEYTPAYQSYFCLPGYPSPIVPAPGQCDFRGEKEMSERLTEGIQREINAYKPPEKS